MYMCTYPYRNTHSHTSTHQSTYPYIHTHLSTTPNAYPYTDTITNAHSPIHTPPTHTLTHPPTHSSTSSHTHSPTHSHPPRSDTMEEQHPKILYDALPMIWMRILIRADVDTTRLRYHCPLYKTSIRKGHHHRSTPVHYY